MLGVRLDEELEARLERLSQQTGRSKSYYAREAIREYVEDREDYEIAVAAAKDATPHISLEELIRKYGLEDQLRQKSGEAVREIGRGAQVQITAYLSQRVALQPDPRKLGKALKGEKKGFWRYRVGDYRVICEIRDRELLVLVLELGHRREVYR